MRDHPLLAAFGNPAPFYHNGLHGIEWLQRHPA